jgi:hypothetical protein
MTVAGRTARSASELASLKIGCPPDTQQGELMLPYQRHDPQAKVHTPSEDWCPAKGEAD